MSELLLAAIGIGVIVEVAMFARLASRDRPVAALSRLEAKVDALLKHQGIRFDPYADAPHAVVDAIRRGNKIEAIKEYRAATGAGLKEAKDYVEALQQRAAPRM